jgi:5-methylcytosine-specific restriction protein A
MEFIVGKIYRRRDLHEAYGGQWQGGISTPIDYPIIFLFTGESGKPFGYEDDFQEDGTFWYTGEGQIGTMAFIRGNQSVLTHRNGKFFILLRLLEKATFCILARPVCSGITLLLEPIAKGINDKRSFLS